MDVKIRNVPEIHSFAFLPIVHTGDTVRVCWDVENADIVTINGNDVAIRTFMKMVGMPIKQFNDMKYQTFIQQAKDFKQLDFDGMNKIIKTISIADDTHPWTVMRVAELLNWMEESSSIFNSLIDVKKDQRTLIDQSVIDSIAKLW